MHRKRMKDTFVSIITKRDAVILIAIRNAFVVVVVVVETADEVQSVCEILVLEFELEIKRGVAIGVAVDVFVSRLILKKD